jgi:GDP-D-mannose dehydratase
MKMEFKVGGKYNWKNQPEQLIYMGGRQYPDGIWHQFAKVDFPDKIWSEVRTNELSNFEETPQELTDTDLLNFIEKNQGNNVFNVGATWYSRQSYMMPHKKHKSLRDAVEFAMGRK